MSENLNEVYGNFKTNLNKVIDHIQSEFLAIRAGRANPKMLDRVYVDYYGTMTPLNQMANISVPEPRMIAISLWDQSMLKATIKAIQESNLGINPNDDGKIIRLVFPQLTEERRKELCKQVRKLAEESKVVARNDRRDSLDEVKKLKKDNLITEDENATAEKEIQKILDEYIVKIDKLTEAKEKEVMEV